MMKVLVEHMEEDMWDWCIKEYIDIFKAVDFQPERLLFTNVPQSQAEKLAREEPRIRTTSLTLWQLLQDDNAVSSSSSSSWSLPRLQDDICLLDSEAETILTPDDKDSFGWILLGGILGNVEEMDFDRTSELRKLEFSHSRHLEKMQMPTNIAARVSLKILDKGIPFESLQFVDYPEFEITPIEKLVVPFRYLKKEDGSDEPMLPEGLYEILLRDNSLDLF